LGRQIFAAAAAQQQATAAPPQEKKSRRQQSAPAPTKRAGANTKGKAGAQKSRRQRGLGTRRAAASAVSSVGHIDQWNFLAMFGMFLHSLQTTLLARLKAVRKSQQGVYKVPTYLLPVCLCA